MSKKYTHQEFVSISTALHGDTYDYSQAQYADRAYPVTLTCRKHSEVFVQLAGTHMDGSTSCSACYLEKRLVTRAAKSREDRANGVRGCKTCSKSLPLEDFPLSSHGKDGVYSVCRSCCAARASMASRCPTNRAKKKLRSAEYTRNNRESANLKSAARRANRLSRLPSWIEPEFEDFFHKEVYQLASLRESCTGFKWQVDHMVPFISDSVCGFHCSDNMQVIPAVENLSKGNKYWPDMP